MRLDIRILGRAEAEDLWGDGITLPNHTTSTNDEINIRSTICAALDDYEGKGFTQYDIDRRLALALYTEVLPVECFPARMAANDGLWRRLSLQVVPDQVARRWPSAPADMGAAAFPRSHFWSSPQRIWLKSLWWYAHLSWQANPYLSTLEIAALTGDILERGSTDAVMHLVERPGTGGFRVDFCRVLMRCLRDTPGFSVTKLKSVLKMHTARVCLVEPAFFRGGVKGYVDELVAEVMGAGQ
jgi:hypothetical protein